MKKVRSAKGQIVDFDLLKLKQQIAAQPAPVNVREREDFIDKKVRRRAKKVKTPESKLDIKVDPVVSVDESVEEPIIDVVDSVEPVTAEEATPPNNTPRPARRRGKNE